MDSEHIVLFRKLKMTDYKKDFKIGNMRLDSQHEKLLNILIYLAEKEEKLLLDDEAMEYINDLMHLLTIHFHDEEELMHVLHMDDSEIHAHTAAHQQILKELTDFYYNLMTISKGTPVKNIFASIEAWIYKHMVTFDIKMIPYLHHRASYSEE